MEFGEKLRLVLKERKLSQTDFASKIEVNKVNVNQIIKGSRTPPVDFILKVVEYFKDVDLNWLLRQETPGDVLNDPRANYTVPLTPAVLIENIESNLKELKAQLSQK